MLLRKLILGVLWQWALQFALLFLPAGTLHWWQGWVLFGVIVVATVATCVDLYRHHPAILAERLKPVLQKGQPLVDKIVLPIILVVFCGWLIFIPLDVFRFGLLLGAPPVALAWLGLALFNVGWWIVWRTMKANAFAAPVIRHQAERKHQVIDTGVYAVVRHPMYAGALLFFFGQALWLGSIAATLAALIPAVFLAIRSTIEERFLRRELPGYEDYTRRVRYRLIPGIW